MKKSTTTIAVLIATGLLLNAIVISGPQPSDYSLDYSEINFGGTASKADTGEYSLDDSLDITGGKIESQLSRDYYVNDLLDNDLHANNGLVLIQGTKVKLSWSEDNKPAGAKGYHIQRAELITDSKKLLITELIELSETPWPHPQYIDAGLQPDTTYLYIVCIVHPDDTRIQWIPTQKATTGDDNRAEILIDELLQLNQILEYPISAPSVQRLDLNQDGTVDIADYFYAKAILNNK